MSAIAFKPNAVMTFLTIEQERIRFLAYCRSLKEDFAVIDLVQVQQCDSAGLAFLIEVKRIVLSQGRSPLFINMPKETLALAEFYGIGQVLFDELKSEKYDFKSRSRTAITANE